MNEIIYLKLTKDTKWYMWLIVQGIWLIKVALFSQKKDIFSLYSPQSYCRCACSVISLKFKIFHFIFYIFKIKKINNSLSNIWAFSSSFVPSSSSVQTKAVTCQKIYDEMECITLTSVSHCIPTLLYKS